MNKIQALEHEFTTFNHLNSSINLLSVSNVLNVTEHLNSEIQETNYKLAAIENDANARKNDFIALFNKADLTERKMETISQKLEEKLNDWNKRGEKHFSLFFLICILCWMLMLLNTVNVTYCTRPEERFV